MEISIGSYKFNFRVEILLLIVIVYCIMFGHVLCSCSKVSLMEGFREAKNTIYSYKQKMASRKGLSSMKKVKKHQRIIEEDDEEE